MTLVHRHDIRDRVILFGIPPPNFVMELRNRSTDCIVLPLNAQRPPQELAFDRAVAIIDNPQRAGRIRLLLEGLIPSALDLGISPFIIATDVSRVRQLRHFLTPFPDGARVKIRAIDPAGVAAIAEELSRQDPGPPANYLTVLTGKLPGPRHEILLRRAFSDSDKILLQHLDGGLSATGVYCVYANLPDAHPGPRPLPFFAKIDSRDKIQAERNNYEQFVKGFVPFNHRPHLSENRSCASREDAILVGTFVEESESLWDVLRRGLGGRAIHSLFDRALRSWRLQSYTNPAHSTASLLGSLTPATERARLLRFNRIPESQSELARTLGATMSPRELSRSVARLPPLRHRVGIIHGDLHSRNIRVYNGDAILIDFSRTCIGPIAFDPAALEVDLAFGDFHFIAEWEMGERRIVDPKGVWKTFIDDLFTPENLKSAPPPSSAPGPRDWLWNSIRQIRTFALADCASELEYLTAVVIQLFHYSSFGDPDEGTSYRRAYAFAMAERLLNAVRHPSTRIR